MTRLLLALVCLCSLVGNIIARETKPNVLLIYTDDHGWADLGAQGVDKDIRTPHLDQLARDGVRFTRGYVSAPQCVPSRAGVITGRYQQKFGVEDNNKGPLPLAEVTIAERLKPAGELAANNRLAQHPDVAARLEAKLKAWSDTLQPPGPPEPNNDQDNGFYAAHVSKTAELQPKTPRKTRPLPQRNIPAACKAGFAATGSSR